MREGYFNTNTAIIVQGPVTYYKEIIKIYNTFKKNVIISTTDKDKNLLDPLIYNGFTVLINELSKVPGKANFNNQVKNTLTGIKKAKEMGFDYVLKIRADIFINDIVKFINLLNTNKIYFSAYHNHDGGYLCEHMLFGETDFMLSLWDIPLSYSSLPPETQLTNKYHEINDGREIDFLFPILYNENIGAYWAKYNMFLNDYKNDNLFTYYMKKNRKKCVLCGDDTKKLFSFNMPVFMGVNLGNTEEHINEMSFNYCNSCGEVQIDELLDLKVIYQNNHNINVVGKIWEQHYTEFSNFISDSIKDKIVLEISDPSAKIAKLSKNFKYWYIIEPNSQKIKIENVEFIDGFFNDNFNAVNNVDVIIHSHLLEHIHDPINFLKKCNNLLKDDGLMIISVPDMEFLLDNGYSPNNILHFEHTYFLNYEVVELMCESNGFEILEFKKYNNHSNFYKIKKKSNILDKKIKLNISQKFKNNFINHIDNIHSINEKLIKYEDYKIYLFGAHVSSQFYLFNGLDITKLNCIIDNDTNKQNHKLYGVDLYVKNPKIVTEDEKCVVICSHIGIYYDEIVKQITELNKNIVIL